MYLSQNSFVEASQSKGAWRLQILRDVENACPLKPFLSSNSDGLKENILYHITTSLLMPEMSLLIFFSLFLTNCSQRHCSELQPAKADIKGEKEKSPGKVAL